MRTFWLLAALILTTAVWGADVGSSAALRHALIIENVGQFPEEVQYAVQQGEDTLWITNESLWISKRGKDAAVNLRLDFDGANTIDIRPTGHSATKVSYFIGNDESQWHPDVPVYSGLRFRNLYEGVDLDINAEGGKLEWRWIVGRGAKVPSRSAIRVSGGDSVVETGDGLEISSRIGEFTVRHPAPYDMNGNWIGGKTQTRNAGAGDLIWSTYVGSSQHSIGSATMDSSGAIYLCGTTFASFPVTPGAMQSVPPQGANGIVIKLNSAGTALLYATYLGGSGSDEAKSIKVDSNGNAFVVGNTASNDFPVLFNAPRKAREADEGFLVKLNGNGTSLLAATLIGGQSYDEAVGVAITPSAKIVVTGVTKSGTMFGANNTCHAVGNFFNCGYIAILNAAATAVEGTFFYGSNDSIAVKALRVDGAGNVIVAGGYTTSEPGFGRSEFFPSLVMLDPATPRFGNANGFVVRLTSANVMTACGIGGSGFDEITDIAINAQGRVVAGGWTNSTNLAVTAGVIRQFGAGIEGFIMMFKPDCSQLYYSTLFGGPGSDFIEAIALDAGGNVYVTGRTNGALPTTSDAYSTTIQGSADGFLALVKNGGQTLAYSTYFGGANSETPVAMEVLPDQTVVILAKTDSTNFPGVTASSYQGVSGGSGTTVISKFKIENPGSISGYAFQDYNQNGTADPYELPLPGLIVYDDANSNGVLDSAAERYAVSINQYGFIPGTNIPFMFAPNYGLNNLPIGVHRICASLAPVVPNASLCKNVTIQFGATTPNVNFGLLPGQVGVSSLTPKVSTVRVGEKLALELNWAHPVQWRQLHEAILRFSDPPNTEVLQISYQEATNTFSVYNENAHKYGPALHPGDNHSLETNEARFHLEESAVQGSGPAGKTVKFRLVISFKPKAAGKVLNAHFLVSGDNGDIQGYEPLGTVTVTR